jgi:hypothetical protein
MGSEKIPISVPNANIVTRIADLLSRKRPFAIPIDGGWTAQ